jgi:hypothetical protein
MALCRAATIESRIMKSPNPFLFKALGDLATAEKSNYATTQRGTAISGLKRGHFAGLGADLRTEKSNCADAAGRATTGFLGWSRLKKVELSNRLLATAARRTDETVRDEALRPSPSDQNTLPISRSSPRARLVGIAGDRNGPRIPPPHHGSPRMTVRLISPLLLQLARICGLVRTVRPCRLSTHRPRWGLEVEGRGFRRLLLATPYLAPGHVQLGSAPVGRPHEFRSPGHARLYARRFGYSCGYQG